MFLAKAPWAVRLFYPNALWHVPTLKRRVYLTFDDGPMPGPTGFVLETLARYNIKATFFMVGENASQHPELVQSISNAGHAIGGHTYNHLSGLKTGTAHYFSNIAKAQDLLRTSLFRPPYGRLSPWQAILFRRRFPTYQLVMWSALSGDYDSKFTPEQCVKNVLKVIKPGSIIVFHDSFKALQNLTGALPAVIERLQNLGYTFHTLPPAN